MTSFDVFLSYHRSDRESVEKVWQILNARGVSAFVDYKNLIAGLPWPRALEQSLRAVRAVAVFIGPELGLWQSREMDYALERQTEEERAGRNFPVIPVLLPGAAITSGFLFRNTWVDLREDLTSADPMDQLLKALQGETAPQTADSLGALCPYQGLKAFREEHAAFFFGREQISKRLSEKVLKEPGLIAVIGPSGSGKSSIVHCGLLPLLRRQRPPAKVWDAVSFTPGDRPFHRLARSLVPLLGSETSEVDRLMEAKKLGDSLAEGNLEIGSVAELIIEKSRGTDRLLVIVDQFEEIFTLSSEKDRKAFVKSMVAAHGRAPLEFVITLRADYWGHVIALSRELSDRLEQSIVNVGPMARDELESAIVQPARKVGLSLESGLAERLLNDVGDEPGNLPLLEFALTELWAQRQGRSMTHAAYESFGGLSGAMSSRAGAELARLNPEERVSVRRIFTRLVQIAVPGQGLQDVRQRLLLDDLGGAARPFVDRLAEARLLVTGRDDNNCETVEVSHEALIQGWTDLQAWLNEDREFLLWRQRLRLHLIEWQNTERDEGWFLRGDMLIEAERWWTARAPDFNEAERDFIGASSNHRRKILLEEEERRREAESQRRRRVRNRAVVVVVLVALLVLSGLQWIRAGRQQRSALAQSLLSRALLTPAARFDEATLLAIESLELEPTAEGEAMVREGFALLPREVNLPWQVDCTPQSVTFSAGGKFLACLNVTSGTAEIIAVAGGEELAELRVTEYETIRKIEASPDGKLLGLGFRSGFKLYNMQTEPPEIMTQAASSETQGSDSSVTFSGNGKYFAGAVFDPNTQRTTVHLFSIADARQFQSFQIDSRILALAFSADGGLLAARHAGDTSTRVTIFDVEARRSLQTIDGGAATASLALSRDASWIAMPDLDSVLVTDTTNQQVYRRSHDRLPRSVALSDDGLYVASGGEDGAARVVDVFADRLIALIPTGSPVRAVAFTADRNLVLVSEDRTVRTINVLDRPAFEALPPVGVRGISPRGRYLTAFSGGSRPELAIIDRQTISKPLEVSPPRQAIPLVAEDPEDLPDLIQGLLQFGVVRYSFDEQFLLAASRDYGVTAYELSSRKTIHRPVAAGTEPIAMAVSGDGRIAALATPEQIDILRIDDGARPAAPLIFPGTRALELSRDGNLVAASSTKNPSLVVFDVSARREIFRRDLDSVVVKAAFSPDAGYLAASSENKDLILVDLRAGTVIALKDVEATLLLFSNEGSILAVGGGGETQRIRAGAPEGQFPFAINLIETTAGNVRSTIQIARQAIGAAFSVDDAYLEVVDNTSLTRHHIRTEGLIEQTCALLTGNLQGSNACGNR